jgi:hypothetical protein
VSALAEDASPAPAFRHEAFLYRDADEFLAGVVGFVLDGLAQGDAVVVAEPADHLSLLRDALRHDLPSDDAVRFLDMAEVGANPARILAVWADALAGAVTAGRRLRGVGEPAWYGRRPQELDECHLHELLLDRAFATGPAWRLMCPYDFRRLSGPVRDRALHSHREWSSPAGRGATGSDLDDALDVAFSARLPAPGGAVLHGTFGAGDVPAVRHTVASWARSCALPRDRVEVLELAASELATNALTHGAGSGTVALWEHRSADRTAAPAARAGRWRGAVPGEPAVRPRAAAVRPPGHHGSRPHLALASRHGCRGAPVHSRPVGRPGGRAGGTG